MGEDSPRAQRGRRHRAGVSGDGCRDQGGRRRGWWRVAIGPGEGGDAGLGLGRALSLSLIFLPILSFKPISHELYLMPTELTIDVLKQVDSYSGVCVSSTEITSTAVLT
jgi:hypothetical protein